MPKELRSWIRTAMMVAAVGTGVSLSAVPVAHASESESGQKTSGKDQRMERRQRVLNRLSNSAVKELRSMGREARNTMRSLVETFKDDACEMAGAGATEDDLFTLALMSIDDIDAAAAKASDDIDAALAARRKSLEARGVSATALAKLDKAAEEAKRMVDRAADAAADRVADALERALEGCDDDDSSPPGDDSPPSGGGDDPPPTPA